MLGCWDFDRGCASTDPTYIFIAGALKGFLMEGKRGMPQIRHTLKLKTFCNLLRHIVRQSHISRFPVSFPARGEGSPV